ncbi:MAG: hypothetical protein Q8941_00920 [Bacteroidota bacterium]|nr:hypothetical protein [Bacteroidota bacterium]
MRKQIIIIRRWIIFFMIILFFSGLTAMPAESELLFLSRCFPPVTPMGEWMERIYLGVANTNKDYPFIAYGFDWLAFAHFILAILFIGPLRDPLRNKWVIEFGMISCALVIPFALVAGYFRGIPFWWRMIDCSFGLVGIIPLGICLKKINRLSRINTKEDPETDSVINTLVV